VAESGTAGGTPLALQFIEGINDVAQQVETIGDLNRGRPLWTVSYLADGAVGTTLTSVTVAWN